MISGNPQRGREGSLALPDADRIEALAGFGLSAAEIARIFDLDEEHVAKAYAKELVTGASKANARVAESLYRKAIGEGRESVTAAIFWLKTHARWKESSVHEHGGVDGRPLNRADQPVCIVLTKAEADL